MNNGVRDRSSPLQQTTFAIIKKIYLLLATIPILKIIFQFINLFYLFIYLFIYLFCLFVNNLRCRLSLFFSLHSSLSLSSLFINNESILNSIQFNPKHAEQMKNGLRERENIGALINYSCRTSSIQLAPTMFAHVFKTERVRVFFLFLFFWVFNFGSFNRFRAERARLLYITCNKRGISSRWLRVRVVCRVKTAAAAATTTTTTTTTTKIITVMIKNRDVRISPPVGEILFYFFFSFSLSLSRYPSVKSVQLLPFIKQNHY